MRKTEEAKGRREGHQESRASRSGLPRFALLVLPFASFSCFSLELGLLAGDLGGAFGLTLLGGAARFRGCGKARLVFTSLLHAASS